MAEEKNKGGRPTKYEEKYNEQAYDLCTEGGFTDKKLAKFFKIAESTINLWKQEYPEFSESIKKGKENFDTDKVETSLLKQALGYKVKEKTVEDIVVDGLIIKGAKKTKIVTKHVVVPTSTYFWLKNRNPQRWRDIKAMEITGKDGGPIDQNITVTFVSAKEKENEEDT